MSRPLRGVTPHPVLIRVTIEMERPGRVVAKGIDEPLRIEAPSVAELLDKLAETMALRNARSVIMVAPVLRPVASA
jgi:hypothetical protein